MGSQIQTCCVETFYVNIISVNDFLLSTDGKRVALSIGSASRPIAKFNASLLQNIFSVRKQSNKKVPYHFFSEISFH